MLKNVTPTNMYRSLRPKPITDRMVKIVNSRLRLMPSRWSNTYFMLSQ